MYESPIMIAIEEAQKQRQDLIDNKIICTINQQCDIKVNKEELIKALLYDRAQYDKGYTDGFKAGQEAMLATLEDLVNVIKAENEL